MPRYTKGDSDRTVHEVGSGEAGPGDGEYAWVRESKVASYARAGYTTLRIVPTSKASCPRDRIYLMKKISIFPGSKEEKMVTKRKTTKKKELEYELIVPDTVGIAPPPEGSEPDLKGLGRLIPIGNLFYIGESKITGNFHVFKRQKDCLGNLYYRLWVVVDKVADSPFLGSQANAIHQILGFILKGHIDRLVSEQKKKEARVESDGD